MKLRLPTCLLFALVVQTIQAQSYYAAGVDETNIMNSELFFDSGKGYFWNDRNQNPRDGLEQLLDGSGVLNATDVLGDLMEMSPYDFLKDDIYFSENLYFHLRDDSLSCWYQSGANVFEYWQHSYGVFADKAVASGYTYKKEYHDDLAGTQSLDLTAKFYEVLDGTVTGNFGKLSEWYFKGSVHDDLKFKVYDAGEYFNSHYTTQRSYTVHDSVTNTDLADFTTAMADALGYKKQADGSYAQEEVGKIASLSTIRTDYNQSGAHVITAYGFEVDENGLLSSIYIADSDDRKYGLTQIFIDATGDRFHLYMDADFTTPWVYGTSGLTYTINGIYSISTSQSLKDLYESYHMASTKQVWSGSIAEWGAVDPLDDGGIATESSGWVRYADATGTEHDGYYASDYESTRAVLFNDYNASAGETARQVSLAKNIEAASIEVNNSQLAYSFDGQNKILSAASLQKSGTQELHIQDTQLQIAEVTISEGKLRSERNRITGNVTVEDAGALHYVGANTIDGSLRLAAGSQLLSDATASLHVTGDLVLQAGFDMSTAASVCSISLQGYLETSATAAYSGAEDIIVHLALDLTNAEGIRLGRALHFTEGSSMTIGAPGSLALILEDTMQLEADGSLLLFEGLDNLWVDGELIDTQAEFLVNDIFRVDAGAILPDNASLVYDAATGTMIVSVPEPSTVTLSLLALTALMRRRRRRR